MIQSVNMWYLVFFMQYDDVLFLISLPDSLSHCFCFGFLARRGKSSLSERIISTAKVALKLSLSEIDDFEIKWNHVTSRFSLTWSSLRESFLGRLAWSLLNEEYKIYRFDLSSSTRLELAPSLLSESSHILKNR